MMQKTKQKATKTKPETLWVENIVNIIQRKDKPLSFAAILTPKLTGSKYVTLEQLDTLRAAQPRKYDRCENCKDEKVVSGLCEICQSSRDARKIAEGMAQGWKEAFDSIRDCPYWGATMAKNRRVLFIFDDQFDELEKGAKI